MTTHFDDIPDELLLRVFEYVPNEHRYFAAVNRRFRKMYPSVITTAVSAVQSIARLQIGMTECDDDYEEKCNIINAAFSVGSLEVLQFLVNEEGEFLRITQGYDSVWHDAALNGRIDVLEWGRERGYMEEFTTDLCSAAAAGGNLDVLEWGRANGYIKLPTLGAHTCPYGIAARNGHIRILEWLWANNYPCYGAPSSYLMHAVNSNRLHVVKWFRTKGCPWDSEAFSVAARCGSMDMIRWLRASNCPWSAVACYNAAEMGRLDVLQFLRNYGCPWDERVCARAASNGHLHVLVWAIENGCFFFRRNCISLSARSDHKAVVDWLTSREADFDDDDFL